MNNDLYKTLVSPQTEQLGVYGLVQKLSESFANQLVNSTFSKQKILHLCYEILLRKTGSIPEGLPVNWDDGDVRNALLLAISNRCAAKNILTEDLHKSLSNSFEALEKNENSEFYKTSVSPTLKMLLCIGYYQKKLPVRKKEPDRFFNTAIITDYLNNLKRFPQKIEKPFISFPQPRVLTHSQSEGSISSFGFSSCLPSKKNFDHIFKLKKKTNDLDEGFVTPNEEHLEKTPFLESKILVTQKAEEKFNWDYATVSIPPSKYKTWESYYMIRRTPKHHPFIHKDTVMQYWLSTVPQGVTKVSREWFIDNLLVLLIGIPSTSFIIHDNSFRLKDGVYTDDLIPREIEVMCQKFIEAAGAFKALTALCENDSNNNDDVITSAMKLALKEYLHRYQTIIYRTKVNLDPKKTCYYKYITQLEPLLQEVIYLKTLLIQNTELKGVALLKQLFNALSFTSKSSMFYVLSALFLLPCMYYFSMVDDWIFLGKWHKDLLLTECDMSAVVDRPSWIEAHKPISSSDPWLVSADVLAHCGKAISLLSLSKNNEPLLKLFKSEDRPKVKLCLQHDELKELEAACEEYYIQGTHCLISKKEEPEDLILCAINAAQRHKEAFENRKIENKFRELQRKKDELLLREEDLKRSANNKAFRKREDDAENKRVADEQEQILVKEQEEEIEKARIKLEKYKQALEQEEKRLRRAEWTVKRHALNEKRRDFFLKHFNTVSPRLLPSSDRDNKHDAEEFCTNKNEENNVKLNTNNEKNKNSNEEIAKTSKKESEKEAEICNSIFQEKISNKNQLSYLEKNRLKVLSSGFDYLKEDKIIKPNEEPLTEVGRDNAKITISSNLINHSNQTNETLNNDLEDMITNNIQQECMSDLEKNRMKVMGSYMSSENSDEKTEPTNEALNNDLEDMITNNIQQDCMSDLEKNRMKVMGSYMSSENSDEKTEPTNDLEDKITNNIQQDCMSDLEKNRMKVMGSYMSSENSDVKTEPTFEKGEHQASNKEDVLSDMKANRMKILGSDLERGAEIRLHVWGDEAERNKRNMLGSHFQLGNENERKIISLENVQNNETKFNVKSVLKKDQNKSSDNISLDINTIEKENEENLSEQNSNTNESEKIALDTNNCEDIGDNTPLIDFHKILRNNISFKNDKFKHIFHSKHPSIIPNDKDIDFTFLKKLVLQSLTTVLNAQTKLVNEALLNMFFNEYDLLRVAQKLREFFFLHGEFGKRLSSSLSKAIEVEQPSTLLTFYRLRNILTESSKGDIKELSFIVKETPVAFDHSNSQVLKCLGLTYKFEWPLNLIFTDRAISKYDEIFAYMFSLQRVSWHLDKVWSTLRFKPASLKGYQYTQIQLYRYVMSQFVCTLQSYIVTTVIENCWQDFIKDISKVKNLDELYRRHAVYIKDIIFKCFLDQKSMKLMTQIQKLLHCILIFCRTLLFGEWSLSDNGEYTHSNFEKLQSTFSSFHSNACYVTRYVEKLVKVNYQKELVNLYTFLNINSFYVLDKRK